MNAILEAIKDLREQIRSDLVFVVQGTKYTEISNQIDSWTEDLASRIGLRVSNPK